MNMMTGKKNLYKKTSHFSNCEDIKHYGTALYFYVLLDVWDERHSLLVQYVQVNQCCSLIQMHDKHVCGHPSPVALV